MPAVTVTLLGGATVRRVGDVRVHIARRKTLALLGYLASSAGRAHSRDKLASLLWPEVEDSAARHSLRQALSTLRQVLPAGALDHDADGGVALDPAAVEVDVVAFQRLVAEGTPAALAQAAALYRGDFLAGLDINEAPFEEWLRSERERLRELAGEALARLLAWQRETGAVGLALQTALQLLTLDPVQEVVHRTVMRLQAALGRRDAALRQYQACVDLLQRELGVEPEAETKELYADILRQREHPSHAERRDTEILPPPLTEPDRGAEPWDSSPSLVGRDGELQRLVQALAERAPAPQRLIVVLGEAGIGKSRLLAEFQSRAAACGARVLRGQAYESTRIVPFGPWADAIRRGGAIEPGAVRDLAPGWKRELERLFPELGERGRDTTEALDDPGPLFEAMAQLLECLAASGPIVVLLEDVHWADGMTARLLASLVRRPRTVPLVLVASARDDELSEAGVLRGVLSELAVERRVERVVLGPLSRAQTAELTQHLARLGSDAATVGALADRMWTASQGLPLIIVEMMAALHHGSPAVVPGDVAIPARMREVIAARLDHLTERARALAAVAAVIGREFEFSLLARAAGLDDGEAATAVEELVRRRILRVSDDRLHFSHEQIRDVVLSELLPARRRILHRQVAEALEAVAAATPDDHPAPLARHYREAGLWEQAARYFRDAGREASARFGEREAVTCFEEALAALGRRPASRTTLEQTVDINIELRSSLVALGEISRVPDCLLAAQAAARALADAGREAWVSLFLAQARWWLGLAPDARAFAEEAEAGTDASKDRPLAITRSLLAGFGWYNAGDYRAAIRAVRRALAWLAGEPVHRRHNHHALPIPMAHILLTISLGELGDFAEASRHGHQALQLAEQTRHRYSRTLALWSLGRLHRVRGDSEEAIRLLEPVLAEQGRIERWRSVAAELGHAYVAAGRVREGLRILEEQRADRPGAHLFRARSRESLGYSYLLAGRLRDAENCADEALRLAHHGHELGVRAWALRLLGEITSRKDPREAKSAAESFGEALTLATDRGMRPLMVHCHLGLGRLARRIDMPEADGHLDRATALARELGMSLGNRAVRASDRGG